MRLQQYEIKNKNKNNGLVCNFKIAKTRLDKTKNEGIREYLYTDSSHAYIFSRVNIELYRENVKLSLC